MYITLQGNSIFSTVNTLTNSVSKKEYQQVAHPKDSVATASVPELVKDHDFKAVRK